MPPTPVFLPGKSHGQRSLAGYSPRDRKESDTTEHLSHKFKFTLIFWHIRQVFEGPGAGVVLRVLHPICTSVRWGRAHSLVEATGQQVCSSAGPEYLLHFQIYQGWPDETSSSVMRALSSAACTASSLQNLCIFFLGPRPAGLPEAPPAPALLLRRAPQACPELGGLHPGGSRQPLQWDRVQS